MFISTPYRSKEGRVVAQQLKLYLIKERIACERIYFLSSNNRDLIQFLFWYCRFSYYSMVVYCKTPVLTISQTKNRHQKYRNSSNWREWSALVTKPLSRTPAPWVGEQVLPTTRPLRQRPLASALHVLVLFSFSGRQHCTMYVFVWAGRYSFVFREVFNRVWTICIVTKSVILTIGRGNWPSKARFPFNYGHSELFLSSMQLRPLKLTYGHENVWNYQLFTFWKWRPVMLKWELAGFQ